MQIGNVLINEALRKRPIKVITSILKRDSLPQILVVCSIILVNFWLYGNSITSPFLFDDPIHFRWLDWHSPFSVWTTAAAYSYYRPLPFFLWKLSSLIFGFYDSTRLHLMNVALHGMNAFLVFLLTRYLFWGHGRFLCATISALIFLTYPFSYQAVAFVCCLTHLLVTFLGLSASICYLEARIHKSASLLAISAIASLLAPFANEAGVVIAGLILLVEIFSLKRKIFDQPSKLPLVYFCISLLTTAIWFAVPKAGEEVHIQSLETLLQSGTYFMQSIPFLLTPLAKWLMALFGWSDLCAVSLISLLGIFALYAVFHLSKRESLFLLAIGWIVIALLPAWLLLGFDYLIDAPRALYFASMAISILHGGVIAILAASPRWRRAGLALSVALVLTILWSNTRFVSKRMALYKLGSRLFLQASKAAMKRRDLSLLYVNLPCWIAPEQSTYALGHEGVTFVCGYYGINDLIYVNTGLEPSIHALTFPNTLRPRGYYYAWYAPKASWQAIAKAVREVDDVWSVVFIPSGPTFIEAGNLEEQDSDFKDRPMLAVFNHRIGLSKVSFELEGDRLRATFWWAALGKMPQSYTVFVHVKDNQDKIVAQWDSQPLHDLFPFSFWKPGDRVRDVRFIPFSAPLPSGEYKVVIGLYDSLTGKRLPALTDFGTKRLTEDALVVYKFEIR